MMTISNPRAATRAHSRSHESMRNTTHMVQRLIARYGSAVAACYAIEDRVIRCKTARCEARLVYLAEAVDLVGRLNGAKS